MMNSLISDQIDPFWASAKSAQRIYENDDDDQIKVKRIICSRFNGKMFYDLGYIRLKFRYVEGTRKRFCYMGSKLPVSKWFEVIRIIRVVSMIEENVKENPIMIKKM